VDVAASVIDVGPDIAVRSSPGAAGALCTAVDHNQAFPVHKDFAAVPLVDVDAAVVATIGQVEHMNRIQASRLGIPGRIQDLAAQGEQSGMILGVEDSTGLGHTDSGSADCKYAAGPQSRDLDHLLRCHTVSGVVKRLPPDTTPDSVGVGSIDFPGVCCLDPSGGYGSRPNVLWLASSMAMFYGCGSSQDESSPARPATSTNYVPSLRPREGLSSINEKLGRSASLGIAPQARHTAAADPLTRRNMG
jgi:hypothetical protein